jgi:5-methylthioadenosine/S-adenosylhomocysteine deaminase
MMVEPNCCDLAITRATVMPFDEGWSVLRDCDVIVRDGRIVALGEGAAIGLEAQASLDGRHLLVVPGLVNAHTHSPEALRRGLAETAPLQPWFERVWSDLDAIDTDEIELAIRLCALEMLRGGVTAVVDHFRQTPMSSAAAHAAARAWRGTGLRTTLALMVRDVGVAPWVRKPYPDFGEQLAVCRHVADEWHIPGGELQVALGPSAPTRCSQELLEGCKALTHERGMRIHMHCDETREEAARAHDIFGCSAVAHLARLGLLGPELSLAHAVWIDDDDRERLADSRTSVVHNPVSNQRMGSGRAPLERFIAQGVQVSIGSDGAASNDGQSVLEALKAAILLPRTAVEDPRQWPGARDGLRMVTRNPCEAFDMGCGRLQAGGVADFAAYDVRHPALAPVNDWHAQFALAGSGLSARHVVVGGRMVLFEGEVLTFDESETLARACELAR